MPADKRQTFYRIKCLLRAGLESVARENLFRGSRGHVGKNRPPAGQLYIGRT